MKRFVDLNATDQNLLLANAFEALAYSGYGRIVVAAAAQHISAVEWWRSICADAGLDECEPWPGFPQPPGELPPGDDRPLPDGETAPS
jgi:hypothetical protein